MWYIWSYLLGHFCTRLIRQNVLGSIAIWTFNMDFNMLDSVANMIPLVCICLLASAYPPSVCRRSVALSAHRNGAVRYIVVHHELYMNFFLFDHRNTAASCGSINKQQKKYFRFIFVFIYYLIVCVHLGFQFISFLPILLYFFLFLFNLFINFQVAFNWCWLIKLRAVDLKWLQFF